MDEAVNEATGFQTLVDVSGQRLPSDTTPHPTMGCFCAEGRVADGAGYVRHWMPPVHDCRYIEARDADPAL